MMEAATRAMLCLLSSPVVAKAAGSPVRKTRLALFPLALSLVSSLALVPLLWRHPLA